ncbi:hypothetical protein [Hoeflea prorocentri]|uniref:Uncharacterized protein n=1 Tax=Hoeflea prorocentri TaxID=1922333 RepID=A0A9X3ZGW7_9HYPH|nr:hypothetical protein [Hoeflea prorocentri]MCY6380251.1 hypothetical protein [Hoeflea prorocentri]MDA5398051.1 hypothetical protein [Hoeflea prorocentri]
MALIVNRVRKNLEMEVPSFAVFVKATDRLSGAPKVSLEWARARRAHMKIFEDRVEIGDWSLPHADVTKATLYRTDGKLKAHLLEIVTPQKTVQINPNTGVDPTPHLPYEVTLAPYPANLQNLRKAFWAVVIAMAAALIFLY